MDMTKAEAIQNLNFILPELSEADLSAILTLAARLQTAPQTVSFNFTDDQLAQLAKSRDDFKNGRTHTLDEVDAELTEFIAAL